MLFVNEFAPVVIPITASMCELTRMIVRQNTSNMRAFGRQDQFQDTDRFDRKTFIGHLGEVAFSKFTHHALDFSADPSQGHHPDFVIDGESIDVKSADPIDGNFYASVKAALIDRPWPDWFAAVKFPGGTDDPAIGTIMGAARGSEIFGPDHLREGKTRADGSKMSDFYCIRFRDLSDCRRWAAEGDWILTHAEVSHLIDTLGWYALADRYRLIASFVRAMNIRVIQ